AHPGLNRLLTLPKQNTPKPVLPLVADDVLERTPGCPATCHPSTAGTHELRNEREKVLKKSLLRGMNKGFPLVA
ncbi:MAG TPA: hypothetical protein VFN02_03740, partial [Ktedonobacteraceae bacterium]|nr:hypothetical protein [Ktedonobacteraceae bacterium]